MTARGRHFSGPTHRSWGQRGVLALNLFACLTCVALAASLTWTWNRVREIPRVELGEQLAATDVAGAGVAQNVLIVGTDSADGLPDDDPVRIGRDAGVRTDTIMLLRVDPAQEAASLLSLPRDLYVPIAGTRGSARINAAIQGGPARLVATVTDALDVPVHHYIELDLAGFRELVDVVDGVPVYFPEPVRDEDAGLLVEEPGCITLDSTQALAFARSRAYEVFRDGRWRVDGTGDLGRISRQQEFIRRALHRAFQVGARNPTVLARLVEDGLGAVTLDDTMTPSDLASIAQRFRSFDPNTLLTYSLPVFDAVIGGAAVLRLDSTGAQPVLDVFRGADPGVVAPDNTVVVVQNGTGQPGVGEAAAAGLTGLGFVVPPGGTGDATSFDVGASTVAYVRGDEQRALLVASALGVDPLLAEAPFLVGADVSVIIGADWPGTGTALRPINPSLLPTTRRTTTTTTTTTTNTTTTTVDEAEQSSTTARIGEVPVPAEPGTC